ncbi:hypothetical protein [Thalassospira lohafexi]|uniref:SGNH/GDSL hydrolase family protein n=1 Tax=Thalassospira lohafexi TaxID=744227 RepID=A0A2N3L1Y4_9PROT|nr:hypothetical protein [Thalassospira lohafexi]PKR56812.1 hypothetical protein COO92_19395 [Thalassospira lohafexi]
MSSSTFNSDRYLVIVLVGGLLVLAFILLGLELFLRNQASGSAGDKQYRERFLHGTAPWVAFGDSHVEGGLLSVAWLDNLGKASDNLETISDKVSLRLQRGGLQGVILPADPQIFSFYRLSAKQENRIDALRSDPSVSLFILNPSYRQYLEKIFWTLVQKPIHFFVGENERTEQYEEADSWNRTIAIRVQLHTPVPNIFDLDAADQYRKMVQALKAHGLAVCLVRYPVSHDYLLAAQKLDGFENAEKFFKSVSSNLNAHYVDLSEILPNEIFDDPDHVPYSARGEVTAFVKERCNI